MSDKMSAAKWQKFRKAIKDVTDTFADTPITIKKREERLAAFNQSVGDSTSITEYDFNAVLVYIGLSTDAQYTQNVKGSFDGSEGYVLINYEEFVLGGLINNEGHHKINEGLDTLFFRNIEHDIIGINQLGPGDGQEAIIKIHFKKRIKKNPL